MHFISCTCIGMSVEYLIWMHDDSMTVIYRSDDGHSAHTCDVQHIGYRQPKPIDENIVRLIFS